ncbi:MAG: YtxH domain-containing protein [Candidatus Aminicenantes bacterium]|nr:YtxH domain-containing protein [Candidatus Aminicenantes bacterium]
MLKIIIGVGIGAVMGFFYYRFIGCRSGACMITSNPYSSTIYWALLGGLIANIF